MSRNDIGKLIKRDTEKLFAIINEEVSKGGTSNLIAKRVSRKYRGPLVLDQKGIASMVRDAMKELTQDGKS